MKKKLICYFSASGVTEKMAKKISNVINGDLFKIEPVESYSSKDLDWTNKNSRSSLEMNDKTSRPKIKNKIENINEYDVVIIGFPVWWYTAPRIINTFLEANNLQNKLVYIFVTSGSSGVEGSFNDLKNMYSNINFLSGKRFTGNETNEEINDWLNNSL